MGCSKVQVLRDGCVIILDVKRLLLAKFKGVGMSHSYEGIHEV